METILLYSPLTRFCVLGLILYSNTKAYRKLVSTLSEPNWICDVVLNSCAYAGHPVSP